MIKAPEKIQSTQLTKMKILAVFLICFGLTLAYYGDKECLFAINQMRAVVVDTRVDAIVLTLWEQRNIGDQLISYSKTLEKTPQLNRAVQNSEEKFQFSEAVNFELQALSALRAYAATKPIPPMKRLNFQVYEFMANNIALSGDRFFAFIDDMLERNSGKRAPITIESQNLISGHVEKMFLEVQSPLLKLFPGARMYVTNAINTFTKFESMFDGVYKRLDMSAFGKQIKLLVEKFESIVTESRFMMEIAAKKPTTLEYKRTKLFVQFALTKIFEVFRMENAHGSISCIVLFLEESPKAVVESYALPSGNNLNATCAAFDDRLNQLKKLLAHFRIETEKESAEYEEFMRTFLENIFSRDNHSLKLDEQFIEILEVLHGSVVNVELRTELEAIENNFGIAPHAASGSGPVYNIRHDYPKLMQRIDAEILQNRNYVVPLIRRLWYSFAKQLLVFYTKEGVSDAAKQLVTDIIQQMQFRSTTRAFKKMPDDDGKLVAPIKFEQLSQFEGTTKALAQLIYDKSGQDNFSSDEMDEIHVRTLAAFYSTQALVYQLKCNHIEEVNERLDETIESVKEAWHELQQATSSLKRVFQPLYKEFAAITSVIANLAKAFEKSKLPIVQLILDQTMGLCDFLDTADIVSYVAISVNNADDDVVSTSLNHDSINETSVHLQSHASTLKYINDFAMQLCGENAQPPTQEQITILIKEISRGNWKMSVDYIQFRKQLIDIFNVLPLPSAENNDERNAHEHLSEIIFECEPYSSSMEEDEEQNEEEVMLDENDLSNALQRMQTNDSISSINSWLDSIQVDE